MSTTERAQSQSPAADLPGGTTTPEPACSKPYASDATQHKATDEHWDDDPPPRKRRSRQLIPPHLAHTTAVFERDAYRCVRCGAWQDLAVKHIVARRYGGSDDMANLHTVCGTCYSRKGAWT